MDYAATTRRLRDSINAGDGEGIGNHNADDSVEANPANVAGRDSDHRNDPTHRI